MSRTLMKTATYAVMHFTVAISVAYALTRSWKVALAVGLVEPAAQTVAFAIHERLWAAHAARAGRVSPATGVQRELERSREEMED
jgi:uncharacterized membrane protein